MVDWWKQRTEKPELMDDHSAGGMALRQAFQHLRLLNRVFGAANPTLFGVKRLWFEAGRPEQLVILDIGAGSGDVNQTILRWADRNDIRLKIMLVDRSKEACEEARNVYASEPRVHVVQGDLFSLPKRCADIVTSTQFVHHFSSGDLPNVIHVMLQASRLGIVINDIHRHWIPWLAVYVVTRIISQNPYIRHDGPLSVAKGFRAADWQKLQEANDVHLSYFWRPLFRYVVIVRKAVNDEASGGKHDQTHV